MKKGYSRGRAGTYLFKRISFLLNQLLNLLRAMSISALVCGDKSEIGLCDLLERSCDSLRDVLGYWRGLAMGEELDEKKLFVRIHVDGANRYCRA